MPSHQSPRFRSLTSFAFLGALIIALTWVSPGSAVDGRDFAGFYDVTNPTDLGNGSEQVTLAVQVFNYSGADVSNTTITLQDSVNLGTDFGSYTGTNSIVQDDSVVLSGNFNISQEEFTRWQNGGAPSLRIDYQDASGNPVRRSIELGAGPVE